MVERLAQFYEKTVEQNLNYLYKVEKELFSDPLLASTFPNILSSSSKNIANKWRNERKYIRTKFVVDALPNYPQEILALSVSIDATVNILDDILDETLSKEEKGLYLVELIRAISLHNLRNTPARIRKAIFNYFNKILIVAMSEMYFLGCLSKQENENDLINSACRYYHGRSLDIDIFAELPLLHTRMAKKDQQAVLNAARAFRIMNLVKKDLKDFERDVSCNIQTALTVLHARKKLTPNLFDGIYNYSLKLCDTKTDKTATIVENFISMLKKEKQEVDKLIRLLPAQ
ncbi:MAG: hypothetical protein QXP42_02640 [Candidatus Micrarchaeia archaeon]